MNWQERSTEVGTQITIRLDTPNDFWRLYSVCLTIAVVVYGVCFWGR